MQFTITRLTEAGVPVIEVEEEGGAPWPASPGPAVDGCTPRTRAHRLARALEARAAIDAGRGGALRPSDLRLGTMMLHDGGRTMMAGG